jgi:hypothetical protein
MPFAAKCLRARATIQLVSKSYRSNIRKKQRPYRLGQGQLLFQLLTVHFLEVPLQVSEGCQDRTEFEEQQFELARPIRSSQVALQGFQVPG